MVMSWLLFHCLDIDHSMVCGYALVFVQNFEANLDLYLLWFMLFPFKSIHNKVELKAELISLVPNVFWNKAITPASQTRSEAVGAQESYGATRELGAGGEHSISTQHLALCRREFCRHLSPYQKDAILPQIQRRINQAGQMIFVDVPTRTPSSWQRL